LGYAAATGLRRSRLRRSNRATPQQPGYAAATVNSPQINENPTVLWRTFCIDPEIPITSCFKKQKKIHKKLEKSLKPSPAAPI
jgi:hypothetical protein